MRTVGSALFALSLIIWFAQPSSAQKSVKACPTFEPQLTASALVDIHINRSLSPAEERALRPCNVFQECALCPQMVVVQAGEFKMGSPAVEEESEDNERPQHTVIISKPFAVGSFAVTFDEWDACVAAGGCRRYRPGDHRWGRGQRPVINIWWEDARAYVRWLADETGKAYRLLSESEYEYAARAGTTTIFSAGDSITTAQANYDGSFTYPLSGGQKGEIRHRTLPVASFDPNPWGLYQLNGNIDEWVEDCWHRNYDGAPSDGSAWTSVDCDRHVLRGGSWNSAPWQLRLASRDSVASAVVFLPAIGFRVARDLVREKFRSPMIVQQRYR